MQIPRSKGGVAFFTFEDLCKGMRGASDYIAVSQAFHTVFIAGIPAMSMQVTSGISSNDVQLLSGALPCARISLLHPSAHCCSLLQLRDQARRFITLVDELYNSQCQLICSADCPPDALFAGSLGEQPIIDLEQLQYEGAVEGELQSVKAGRSMLLLSCSCICLLPCSCIAC